MSLEIFDGASDDRIEVLLSFSLTDSLGFSTMSVTPFISIFEEFDFSLTLLNLSAAKPIYGCGFGLLTTFGDDCGCGCKLIDSFESDLLESVYVVVDEILDTWSGTTETKSLSRSTPGRKSDSSCGRMSVRSFWTIFINTGTSVLKMSCSRLADDEGTLASALRLSFDFLI